MRGSAQHACGAAQLSAVQALAPPTRMLRLARVVRTGCIEMLGHPVLLGRCCKALPRSRAGMHECPRVASCCLWPPPCARFRPPPLPASMPLAVQGSLNRPAHPALRPVPHPMAPLCCSLAGAKASTTSWPAWRTLRWAPPSAGTCSKAGSGSALASDQLVGPWPDQQKALQAPAAGCWAQGAARPEREAASQACHSLCACRCVLDANNGTCRM